MGEYANPDDALFAGDPSAAITWYDNRGPDVIKASWQIYTWAFLLCEAGRAAEADALLEHLPDNEDYAMFVAGRRLIGAMESGLPAEEALRVTPLGAAARHMGAIAAAMTGFDIARRPAPARHIAICGVSFCGSTLTNLILGGLPRVASIGESTLLTTSYDGHNRAPRDFSQTSEGAIWGCDYCGPNCAVVTPTFRTAMALNPTDWFFRIAARLKTKVLISADKNIPRIVRYDPRLRFQALVVFKSPKQAWASNYARIISRANDHFSRIADGLTPKSCRDEMVNYMNVWKINYERLINSFKPEGGKLFLDFERFVSAPQDQLRRLTRALDLEHDPTALIGPARTHSLGANRIALGKLRAAHFRIDIRPLAEPAIPADHGDWIDHQPDLNDLHAELRRLARGLNGQL